MRFAIPAAVALIVSASPAVAQIERQAEQRLADELRCTRAPQPVALVRWLIRNGLVRSVGPGADGVAALIPTRRLTLLGRPILYIEAWGTVATPSGRHVAPPPFAMSAGTHMEFVSVLLQGHRQQVEPLVRSRLGRAQVAGERNAAMQAIEVICTQFGTAD